MAEPLLPLASSSWDQNEYDAMQRVISSGMFSMGANVKAFETAFAEFMGSNYAVMVNSGSSANLLMVAALFYTEDQEQRLQRGDEVIVPAVGWSTTYFPLYQYGLKLKFVDIDLETLNYDLSALEQAISERTRAIMAVNLLGSPNDFTQLCSMIGDRNIVLLEDNCESMGARFEGRYTGTFGLMGTFSSFFSHHISTMEGGLILTDDEELHHILLSLRAHGWTRNLPDDNRVCGAKSQDLFEESFRFVLPGYNVRPLELSGAIGIEQLKKLPNIIAQRRNNAEFLVELMQSNDQVMLQREMGESSWFGFALIIKPGSPLRRGDIIQRLDDAGVDYRPIVTGDFSKNAVVEQYFDYEIHGELSNAAYLDANGLMIGNHHYDLTEPLSKLAKLLAS